MVWLHYIFRRYVIGMLDIPMIDRFTWVLVKAGLKVGHYLPDRFYVRFNLLSMNLAVWLNQFLFSYWIFWLRYYLKRDTGWIETRKRILLNVFCPISMLHFYRNLIFEPDKLDNYKPEGQELKLYRERQIRCGFVPQM